MQKTFSKIAQTSLGRGVLTWTPYERQSDRYGVVYLIEEGHDSFTREPSPSQVDEAVACAFEGFAGELIAVVKAARISTHIGDIHRGVYPRKPEVGQVIVLGKGRLFRAPIVEGGVGVGLRPDDGRAVDWLSIRALYDAHEQTVDLSFVPEGR